ncbi:UBP1-associated proteins 1C-like protein [Cinnamomum micranthum f. kanehirae]|uniref:UBP1-associated proteins 1C-like protein n=1 Tax=Cinnamomum micranthum f. kanehirae TaxID=337451 RepID=A0A3S3QJB9_9MAGN|nr:UBP1-associated proteins 1C-like protein [Cinnamomum micranthum f. kanehirae]
MAKTTSTEKKRTWSKRNREPQGMWTTIGGELVVDRVGFIEEIDGDEDSLLHFTNMEFKYRAGEDPLPPLGGVLGRENRPSDLMHSRDLLRREMKEQIREEIMTMRREIEDEVIMEMSMEKEISMRAEAGLMSSSLSSQPLGIQRNLQRMVGLLPIRTHQRLLEREGGEKAVPVLSEKNAGAVTDKGVSVDDGVTRIDSEVGDKEKELLCKSSMNDFLAGSKRKAYLIGNLELASPKKAHNNWSCPLCQVSTTCERALNEHFEGKKHKAREKVLVEKSIITRNGPEPQQVCSIEAGKPMVSFLRCHYCNVLCNSEVVMATHLKGKKHVARTAWASKTGGRLSGDHPRHRNEYEISSKI